MYRPVALLLQHAARMKMTSVGYIVTHGAGQSHAVAKSRNGPKMVPCLLTSNDP